MVAVAMKFDKRFFFDRNVVKDLIGKKSASAMSKAGAFIRRRARSSMRRRKKASAAGQPPSAHSKDAVATLKNIQFAFDPARQSLLVGPRKLNGNSGEPVPGLHEHGGSLLLNQWRWKPIVFFRQKVKDHTGKREPVNDWRTTSKKRIRRIKSSARGAPLFEFREQKIDYPPRPFMGPALVAELPKFPSLFGRSA